MGEMKSMSERLKEEIAKELGYIIQLLLKVGVQCLQEIAVRRLKKLLKLQIKTSTASS